MIFTGKLKGTFACLFAKSCESYIEKVSDCCNDTSSELPVWSGLSPQQRLRLVREVMVGLLCEKESLARIQTAQHFLAFLGIWYNIRCDLDVEIDTACDHIE
eukprot:Awhi_evm1s6370